MENEEIKNQVSTEEKGEVQATVNTAEQTKVDKNVDSKVADTKAKDSKVEKSKLDKNNKKKKQVKENKGPGKVAKTMSELKKVSWPSFKEVVKQTSVVLVVVLSFLLVIFGLDKLCSWLIGLICS